MMARRGPQVAVRRRDAPATFKNARGERAVGGDAEVAFADVFGDPDA
jgi:hypothetical protein